MPISKSARKRRKFPIKSPFYNIRFTKNQRPKEVFLESADLLLFRKMSGRAFYRRKWKLLLWSFLNNKGFTLCYWSKY
ncbi:hypothetical protein CH365_04495 [Leptospira neocaledonica]|uniref:Uncharacterized protein n=1 Tax=Leptospira neocaledonica TaxID=2023192 RepID=A0A2N0A2N0_9LEPT|nr:hypothetical protein CH365_04495 [Leptospira neocaledonica]